MVDPAQTAAKLCFDSVIDAPVAIMAVEGDDDDIVGEAEGVVAGVGTAVVVEEETTLIKVLCLLLLL